MKVINAFRTGLSGVLGQKAMWFIFYAVQFAFAWILVQPIEKNLTELIGWSMAGDEILAGNGANILFEFMAHKQAAIIAWSSLFVPAAILFILVTIFLKAGAVSLFVKRESFTAAEFFKSAGLYFWRFFRLFLFSLAFFAVSILIYMLLNSLLKSLAGDSERLRVMLTIVGFAILGFLFLLVRMVFDYAKIMAVASGSGKMVRTSLAAWRFVLRHPGKTLGLFYLVGIAGLLLWAVYYGIGGLIPAAGFGITIMFIWQQLFAFSRTGIVLWQLASQSALYGEMHR
ncbi:hypothetical protein JXO52_12460 [bacterium]|nr:hypothetical protein [bacterium]